MTKKIKKTEENVENYMTNFSQMQNSTAGFTLLLSSLLAGLFLAIGTGIFNIVFKEISLTSSVRESQFAFYSADTGIECALFWDLKGREFATSTASSGTSTGTVCNSQDITSSSEWNVITDSNSAITTFNLTFPPSENCVTVIVTKNAGDTTIESRGYNTCNTSSLRRAERGIRVSY